MSQRFSPFSVAKRNFFPSFLLFFTLLVSWTTVQAALPARQDLLQFTSAGHVLAFRSDGLYVAGGDHMLHVGFVGTSGIAPETANSLRHGGKVQTLVRVSYHDLWPGIDLHYIVKAGAIAESTWEIAPESDTDRIRLRYNAPVVIMADGSLRMHYKTGWLGESAPVAWQKINGHCRPVKVSFRLIDASQNESTIGFVVGSHDCNHPVMIDPILSWNTFLGAAAYDTGNALTLDNQNNVYVAGYSVGSWGNPVTAYAGLADAFVAKFNSSGTLLWNTFMGSANYDFANAVIVDGNHDIYVAGESRATWGSPVSPYMGGGDAFAAKLNGNGVLQWNTFMGSTADDTGQTLAVNGNNIYVAGSSQATWGNNPINPYVGDEEAFVAKLNQNGVLQWNTFMGSSELDYGIGIDVDNSGNVYVGGYSEKSWGTPIRGFTGSTFDVFVAKLAGNGSRVWNTFLGSSAVDSGGALAVNKDTVYVVGSSGAAWGSPRRNFSGGGDAFVAALNKSGVLLWNTFLGSAADDQGLAVAADGSGTIYVSGKSDAMWGNGGQAYVGGADSFVAKLGNNGSFNWNVFLGSTDDDEGAGITVDQGHNIYLTGRSDSTWGNPARAHAGGPSPDAFVAKLHLNCRFYIFRSKNGKTTTVCM